MKAFQRRIFMAGYMTQTETETEPFKAFTMVSFNSMIMMWLMVIVLLLLLIIIVMKKLMTVIIQVSRW